MYDESVDDDERTSTRVYCEMLLMANATERLIVNVDETARRFRDFPTFQRQTIRHGDCCLLSLRFYGCNENFTWEGRG